MKKFRSYLNIKSYFKNDYVLNLVAKIIMTIMGIISSAFLTRYFGIKLRGDYAYVNQFVAIVAIIFNLGINQSYSYFYKKKKGGIYHQFANLFLAQLIINIFTFALIALFFRNSIYMYIAFLLPFSIVTQNYQSCMTVENIKLKIALQIFISVIKTVTYLLIFLLCPRKLWIPIIITIAIDIVTLVVYVKKMKYCPNPFRLTSETIKETIRYSWIFVLSTLLLTLNYSVDIILLKHMGTADHLSLYSTAVGIINYVWLIPDVFKEVLISRVSRSQSMRVVLLSIKISVILVVIIFIVFCLCGKLVIQVLYGKEFLGSYNVTIILILGAISMVYFKLIGVMFMAEGRKYFHFFTLLVSALINIILNLIMIPILGMYGAALSSIVSYSICGLVFLGYFIRVKKLKTKEILLLSKSEIELLKKSLFKGGQPVE